MSYDFADRLIELRRGRGLSQEELAKELGLTRQAISKWERAESAPDIGNLVALSEIYEVTLDDLVHDAASKKTDPSPENAFDFESKKDGAADPDSSMCSDAVEVDAVVIEECPKGDEAGFNAAEFFEEHGAFDSQEHATGANDVSPTSQPVDFSDTKNAQTPPPPAEGTVWIADSNMTFNGKAKKPKNLLMAFPYPLLVVLVYLILGFGFGLWHPFWILFITIPFYYWIVAVLSNDPEFLAHHDRARERHRAQGE